MKEAEIKKVVREGYAEIAKKEGSCCTPTGSCCGSADLAQTISKTIGYTDEELTSVPEGANLGLGCGNPVALASLAEGETILDLGSGAGFDCFLAANRVGQQGKVIGVDMTPEMIDKARAILDWEKRQKLYTEIQKTIVDDAPEIFGMQYNRRWAFRDWVKGFVFCPVRFTGEIDMHTLYIEE